MSAELVSALESFGMIVDRPLKLDGNPERFKVAGKKGRPGYVLGNIVNGNVYATFGSWTDRSREMRFPNGGEVSPVDHEILDEIIDLARSIREQEQKEAKRKAQWMWSNSTEADPEHPYLVKKDIENHGCRQYKDSLMIPLYDAEGQVVSLQWIKPDGEKIFLKNGKKQGSCFPIKGDDSTVYIAEGYATAATINELTGNKVLVAFDAGNIKPVAKAARGMWPEAHIVIAADNDHKTDGNPGVTYARAAAEEINAEVVIPSGTGTDFNDMCAERGGEQTLARLKGKAPVLEYRSVKEIMATKYAPLKWAAEGIIPEGLTILAGRPKFGKSWLMLGLGYAISMGLPAWEYANTYQGSVYYLALEDSNRRIQSRVYAMEGYFDHYPECFKIMVDFPRIGDGFLRGVKELCAADKDVRCIIVDTLQKIRPKSAGKRNLYQAEYEDYERVQKLSIEMGIPIICVHHTKKRQGNQMPDNPVDEMSGSTGLQGVADTLIVCTRDGNNGQMFVTGREVDEETYPMEFNRINMTWTVSAPEDAVLDTGPLLLTAYFKTHMRITAKEAAVEFDVNQRTAKRRLNKMVEEGLLDKTVPENPTHPEVYSPSNIFYTI